MQLPLNWGSANSVKCHAQIHSLLMKCYGRGWRPQITVVQSFFWPKLPCNWMSEDPQHCIILPLSHFFSPYVMNPCMLALCGHIIRHPFVMNSRIKFHSILIFRIVGCRKATARDFWTNCGPKIDPGGTPWNQILPAWVMRKQSRQKRWARG